MKNGDRPAYPGEYKNNDGTTDFEPGLTKREVFAKDAMVGLILKQSNYIVSPSLLAKESLELADELLKALEQ